MATSTISHRELQQDYEAAAEATHSGPVFITKNGKPQAVLIDIAEYLKLASRPAYAANPPGQSLAELLAVPESEYFDWEPPRLSGTLYQPAELD